MTVAADGLVSWTPAAVDRVPVVLRASDATLFSDQGWTLDVVAAHRGAIWLQVIGHGKTAHGSAPHLGVNAIDHVVTLVGWLRERWPQYPYTPHDLLAPPTMNLGTISGGIKTNVVPDRCEATVDLRTVPGQDHEAIVREVRDMAAELESTTPGLRLEINVGNDMPPVETPVGHPLIRHAAGAVEEVVGAAPAVRGATYYTDGGMWVGLDVPMVIINSPFRSFVAPVISYIDALDRADPGQYVTVVLPEYRTAWWQAILHNQSSRRLKNALIDRPNTVIIEVPYHLDTADAEAEGE